MEFFGTFRGRLLLIFAFLIVATLAVQYYLNLFEQQANTERREVQEQALVAGISLGVSGITSTEYLQDLISVPGQTFLDESSRQRIRDVIIINNRWQITDSLNTDLLPTIVDDGTTEYKNLKELTDLPPLMEGARLGADLEQFPNRKSETNTLTDDEAHAIPVQTSDGRFYVMVLRRNDKDAARRAARPLLATLGILLISTLITIILV